MGEIGRNSCRDELNGKAGVDDFPFAISDGDVWAMSLKLMKSRWMSSKEEAPGSHDDMPPHFIPIDERIVLCDDAISKEPKAMRCGCTTSAEERSKGIEACGSGCLNRLLFMECGYVSESSSSRGQWSSIRVLSLHGDPRAGFIEPFHRLKHHKIEIWTPIREKKRGESKEDSDTREKRDQYG